MDMPVILKYICCGKLKEIEINLGESVVKLLCEPLFGEKSLSTYGQLLYNI